MRRFSSPGVLSGRRGWASCGGVRWEQPPSFSKSPAVPGLAQEASPRAGGEETESEGAARRGADGRPPRLPGSTVCAARRGRRRRTKAVVAAGPWRGRAGRRVLSGSVLWARCLRFRGSARLAQLRSCAPRRSCCSRRGERLRPRRERGPWRRTGFLLFGPCPYSFRFPAGMGASHLGVSLTSVPLASLLALSHGRLPQRSGVCDPHLRRGSRRPPLGPAREVVWGRRPAFPCAGIRARFLPR